MAEKNSLVFREYFPDRAWGTGLASPLAKIALEFSRQKRRQISGNSSQVPEPDHQKPQTFWIKVLRQNQRYRDPSRFSLQRSWFQTRFARTNNIAVWNRS